MSTAAQAPPLIRAAAADGIGVRAVRLPSDVRPVQQRDVRFLGADDAARVRSYRQPADQWRTLLGRALIIAGLRAEFGIERPLLELSPRGRPTLAGTAGNRAPGAPDFNVSHAGDWVVCALTALGSVGVDVSPIAEFHDWPRLQHHYLSAREIDSISGASASERQLLAARHWTLKEAILKCAGFGLEIDPRLIEIDLHPHPTWRRAHRDLPDPRTLAWMEPVLAPDHRLAIALAGPAIGPQAGLRVDLTILDADELLDRLCH